MYPSDFCYWLQGKFEIDGEDTTAELSTEQVDLIKTHLKMVDAVQGDSTRFPALFVGNDFCHWLNGLFAGIDSGTLSIKRVDIIRKKLNDTFVHKVEIVRGDRDESQFENVGDGLPHESGSSGELEAMC